MNWTSQIAKLSLFLLLAGCGERPDQNFSQTQEPINTRNDPTRIDPGIEWSMNTYLATLPLSGQTEKPVWFGNWYPASENGTAAASRKYDRAFGQAALAEKWELQTSAASAHVGWAGHCNGLAAASINVPEPVRSVTFNNVVFTKDDVKALLVEAYQGFTGSPTGGRCIEDTITFDQYGRPTNSWCRDLNAGTFHIALANFLGTHGLSVILDISPGVAVWNYAARSFSTSIQRISAAEAINLTATGESEYPFNPDAVFFYKASTTVNLANSNTVNLSYILELDAVGYIIGGEWIGDSRTNHPDFIWRQTAPQIENPYLSIDRIMQIANMSF